MLRRWFVVALVLSLAGVPLLAQDAKKKKAPNPAYQQIEDVPGLPRVLILGDSISIGYTLAVREELKGKANVHRPATNCGPTTNGVKNIDAWLGAGKWDVIHFNFGLHDLKYIDDKGQLVEPAKGKPQVSLDDYQKNLETIVARLKKTGAKLIFCTTTPVPEGSNGRIKGDELQYNKVAQVVMKNHGVAIDDLYAFALPKLAEIQLPKNVHFTAEGSKVLAKQVASSIAEALEKK
ncbi:MAG: SGNH/GDSL hydrolase family protein [Pirellulaceae bacterium]|nr:SGNH/GDSL hydrolase family protein [Pirellulaceae bacterium]